jgi:hypothetical protein
MRGLLTSFTLLVLLGAVVVGVPAQQPAPQQQPHGSSFSGISAIS